MHTAAIASYLQQHARPVDLALYRFHFEGGSPDAVLQALAAYQNTDGGFGNGIEPDLPLPLSSAIATAVALQYATAVDASAQEPLIQRSISYLLKTRDHRTHGWGIVPKAVDEYPHAPWWGYESTTGPNGFSWGNPAAELLGYLLAYRNLVDDPALLETVTQTALRRLTDADKPDFHELLCYTRLYDRADPALQSQLYPMLSRHIAQAVNPDPDTWVAYSATPLTFATSPDSTFASLFDSAATQADLDRLERAVVADSHWEPNWSWGPDYPDSWVRAKQEWSGKLTVEKLLVLKAFGR